MKLKKLLAAVTAAALAVSTMAVSSFTASAEDETTPITLYEYDASAVTIPESVTISKSDADWTNAEKITIVVTGEKEESAEWCSYYMQETTTWKMASVNNNGTSIINADTETDSEKVFDNFKAASEIKLILQNYGELSTITVAFDDNTPVTVYDSDNLPNGKVFPASGDLININAAKLKEYGVTAENIADCSVEITYGTTPDASECGINVLNDWIKNIVYVKNINSASKTVSLSEITEKEFVDAAIETGIMIQLKSCVVTKVVLNVPASTEEETGEIEITVDPKTKSIAVDETFDITVDVTASENLGDGGVVDGNITWDFDETVVDVTYDKEKDVYTVTGIAAGETQITFTWEPTEESGVTVENPVTDKCTVTVTDDGEEGGNNGEDEPAPTDKTVTGSATIVGSGWWATKAISVEELLGDLDKTKAKITFTSNEKFLVYFKNVAVVDATAEDPYWDQTEVAAKGTKVVNASDIDFDDYNVGVAVSRDDGQEVTITWTATESDSPATPEEPETPSESTSVVLSEETTVMASDWSSYLQIPAAKFADITSAGKIVVTVTDVASGAQYGLRTGEWTNINDYDDVSGTSYEYAVDDTLLATLKASGLIVSGHDYTVTKVEYVTSGSGSTPATPPATGDDDINNDDNNNSETPAVTYVPTVNNIVIPYGYTPATDEEIANTVSSTAEGDTASVNLTSNTRVEKSVLDTIAGKDITVEFKLKGGVRWIINGKNVEKSKKVDLGVRLRSKNIPAEKIAEVAGDNKTMQFSLRHNGDLGFTGALIVPFSASYNGKFANLYYYNTAKDELEFVGSSKISGGEASFVFTHASDYVVVIDDEAYGEDVSSAAGVYETSEETTAPYAAAVSAIVVLGVAAVVIRKRLAK